MSLVYGLTPRTSLDLDFSMQADFENFLEARTRLFQVLRDRFDAAGYVVFDEKLETKPELRGEDQKPWWGGYQLSFKLIDRRQYETLKTRPGKLRVNALAVGSKQERSFKIDLSKCEYVDGKVEREFDEFTIYVYSPEMIVIEKLRAICQQMEEYPHTGNKDARARDFYDIHHVMTACRMEIASPENLALARHIFAAKRVPLTLLQNIARERHFHQIDWPAVEAATQEPLESFDFYFDFVLRQVERLQSLWME